jgi:hypothetical protein
MEDIKNEVPSLSININNNNNNNGGGGGVNDYYLDDAKISAIMLYQRQIFQQQNIELHQQQQLIYLTMYNQ